MATCDRENSPCTTTRFSQRTESGCAHALMLANACTTRLSYRVASVGFMRSPSKARRVVAFRGMVWRLAPSSPAQPLVTSRQMLRSAIYESMSPRPIGTDMLLRRERGATNKEHPGNEMKAYDVVMTRASVSKRDNASDRRQMNCFSHRGRCRARSRYHGQPNNFPTHPRQ